MSETARTPEVGGPAARDDGDVHLVLRPAHGEPRRWPLPATGGVVTIGRSPETDIHLDDDRLISRLHATLERVAGQWTIVDDGLSANGTYVNGRRVTGRARLRDRDTIRLGTTLLTFCSPAQTASSQTVAGNEIPAVRRLTEQQRLVLQALCRPYQDHAYATPATNQQIGEELTLSLDAVKTHLRVLFHKFGIEDLPQNQKRARLAELALTLDLVSKS